MLYLILSLLTTITMFYTPFKHPIYLFLLLINVLLISHVCCKLEGHHYARGTGHEHVKVKIPYFIAG